MAKQDGAFLTIGELAGELDVPHHILRYWETRFPMLRPLQRAGNRRYYRPEDVVLARTIHRLLNIEGYTVKGAQQALAGQVVKEAPVDEAEPAEASGTVSDMVETAPTTDPSEDASPVPPAEIIGRLEAVRDKLKKALEP